jgi:hypothetical protein
MKTNELTGGEIDIFVGNNSGLRSLLNAVRAFYGKSLRVDWTDKTISTVEFDPDQVPIEIRINLCNSPRAAESLAHELLHLKLMADGFAVAVARHKDWFCHAERATIYDLMNVIQHELMLPQFLSMGFPVEAFFADVGRFDPVEQARALENEDKDFVRRLWCIKLACEMIQHPSGIESRVEQTYRVGAKLMPTTMAQDYEWLLDWMKNGKRLLVSTQAQAVASLLDYAGMRLPRFYTVRKSGVAIQLVETSSDWLADS